jgi:hypothetical protein
MKDEIFKKWCSKCGVVTTTLSAQFCPDCGDGPLQVDGGARDVKIIAKLPDYDDLPDYGLTTVEAHDLYDYYMNHKSIKLSIRINFGHIPVIVAVNDHPVEQVMPKLSEQWNDIKWHLRDDVKEQIARIPFGNPPNPQKSWPSVNEVEYVDKKTGRYLNQPEKEMEVMDYQLGHATTFLKDHLVLNKEEALILIFWNYEWCNMIISRLEGKYECRLKDVLDDIFAEV